jgi:anion-transporting  ArsA/GET3 family ATPase
MTAGKLYELTEWRRSSSDAEGRRRYDLVVVDAPPTGQLVSMLRSPRIFLDILRVGRPHRQLQSIDRMVRRAGIVLVAIPEEMSVAETLETAAALQEEGLAAAAVVANRVLPPAFPKGTRAAANRMDARSLAGLLDEVDAAATEEEAGVLLEAARGRDGRATAQKDHLAALSGAGPVTELPFLFTPSFGPPEVDALAAELAP